MMRLLFLSLLFTGIRPLCAAQDSTAVNLGWTGFSPDGKLIVTTLTHTTYHNDKEVKRSAQIMLYSADNGKLVRTLDAHAASVNSIVFHPTRTQMLTCSNDGTSKLWDYSTGVLVKTLEQNTDYAVEFGKFNKSGDLIATASYGRVRIWDGVTGTLRFTLPHDQWPVHQMEFSDDGRYLETIPVFRNEYYASMVGLPFNARSMIWELSTGRFLRVRRKLSYYDTLTGPHPYRAFSPDTVEYKGRELFELAKTAINDDNYCDCGTFKVTYNDNQLILWDTKAYTQTPIEASGPDGQVVMNYNCRYVVFSNKIMTLPDQRVLPAPASPYAFGTIDDFGLLTNKLKISPTGDKAMYYNDNRGYPQGPVVGDTIVINVIDLPGVRQLFAIPVR